MQVPQQKQWDVFVGDRVPCKAGIHIQPQRAPCRPLGLDVDSGLAGYLGSDKQKLLTKAEQWRKGEKQNELAKRSY